MNDEQTTLAQLRKAVARFVDDRDWNQFHDPKNLAMSIAIESAELMEHFQWLRSDQLAGVRESTEIMADIRHEVADILCFVLSFANAMQIDLSEAVEDKLARNAQKYPAEEFRGRFR